MRLNTIAYYADFYLSGAIIAALFIQGVLLAFRPDGLIEISTWIASAFVGIVVWSLTEYAVHRFAYHRVPFFQELHDAHHDEPDAFIGAPPLIGIAMIFTFGYLPFFAYSMTIASGLTSGLLVGYMGYMVIHHAAHHWKPEPGTWLYMLRRHHALHHYRSENGNFGIITSFWDHVFGTALEPVNRRPDRHTA